MAEFCGCTYDTNPFDSPENLSEWCCVREIWKDTGRCIWHANVENKPVADLEKHRSDSPEKLDGALLQGVEIDSKIDFEGCSIAYADFTNASLQGTNFENTVLYKGKFNQADLDSANLSNSFLDSAEFRNAILEAANLSDSSAMRADFTNSNLLWADIQSAILTLADLSNAELDGAEGPPETLEDAHLTECYLSGVDLTGTNMAWAKCRGTDLRSANLEEARLHRARMREAKLWKANLRDADLTEASVHECNLEDVNFEGVDAHRADFSGSNLENATFIRAELREATLKDTPLYQTVFSDVRINDSTLFGDFTTYDEQWDEPFSNPFDASAKKSENDANWHKAVWTYRRLESLHEENAMSERARWYHIRKQEARRQLYWSDGEYLKWGIYFVNRWLTNHGESPFRVLAASAITIIVSAVLYPFVGISRGSNSPLTYFSVPPEQIPVVLGESLYFSTVTFTTLGYGDVQPTSPLTQALAGVESLLGVLLMALLVFVLGRRATR